MNLTAVKFVVSGIAGAGVSKVVLDVVRSHVIAPTPVSRFMARTGYIVIGAMATSYTGTYVDKVIDQMAESFSSKVKITHEEDGPVRVELIRSEEDSKDDESGKDDETMNNDVENKSS